MARGNRYGEGESDRHSRHSLGRAVTDDKADDVAPGPGPVLSQSNLFATGCVGWDRRLPAGL